MQSLPGPLLAAINHLLGQATWAREKLAPFAGRAVQVKLPPFEAAFLIGEDGCICALWAETAADVSIALPATTPLLALQGKEAVMRAARIEGSVELAEALGFVIRNLQWEVEEDLSRVIGDVAAHRMVAGSRELAAWQRQAVRNFAENLAEYFTEEQPLVARRGAIADFSAEVDRLRDDVAQLEKRVQRLA